jgi:hypothetical protein
MGWIRNVSLTRFEAGKPIATSPEDEILQRLNVKRGGEVWASGDFAEALKLLLPAAEQGNPVAQHRIGVMYVMGQEVPEDYAQATYWFRKAADQGQGESQYSMALRYSWGQGVAQDYKEAVRWFTLAANQGVVLAAAALKNRYSEGEGVPRDLVEAYKWGELASKGSMIDVATTTGRSARDAATLKMNAEQIGEAQRRATAFIPHQPKPSEVPEPSWVQQIKLNGMVGPPERRRAIINGKGLEKGEQALLKLGERTVTLRCLEVRESSVVITIDGLDGTRELRMR